MQALPSSTAADHSCLLLSTDEALALNEFPAPSINTDGDPSSCLLAPALAAHAACVALPAAACDSTAAFLSRTYALLGQSGTLRSKGTTAAPPPAGTATAQQVPAGSVSQDQLNSGSSLGRRLFNAPGSVSQEHLDSESSLGRRVLNQPAPAPTSTHANSLGALYGAHGAVGLDSGSSLGRRVLGVDAATVPSVPCGAARVFTRDLLAAQKLRDAAQLLTVSHPTELRTVSHPADTLIITDANPAETLRITDAVDAHVDSAPATQIAFAATEHAAIEHARALPAVRSSGAAYWTLSDDSFSANQRRLQDTARAIPAAAADTSASAFAVTQPVTQRRLLDATTATASAANDTSAVAAGPIYGAVSPPAWSIVVQALGSTAVASWSLHAQCLPESVALCPDNCSGRGECALRSDGECASPAYWLSSCLGRFGFGRFGFLFLG